jgi:hypothetical protein
MAYLRQYDPLKVVGSFYCPLGAIDIVEGAIFGDFLMVTKDLPMFERDTDGFGNSIRVKNNNIGGTINLQLSASSPTNEELSKVALSDYLSETTGLGYMNLEEVGGNSQIIATGVYLRDFPQVTFGVNRGVRSWTFECAAIQHVLIRGFENV